VIGSWERKKKCIKGQMGGDEGVSKKGQGGEGKKGGGKKRVKPGRKDVKKKKQTYLDFQKGVGGGS